MLTLLYDYLKDREIIIKSINRKFESNVHTGVSQSSLVGPLLWNLVYVGLFNKFTTIKNFKTVAFADDLAILMDFNKEETIKNKLNINISKIMTWCNNAGLQITKEKAEIILLTGMRIPKIINVNIINMLITTNNTIIYLGLTSGNIRNYTVH